MKVSPTKQQAEQIRFQPASEVVSRSDPAHECLHQQRWRFCLSIGVWVIMIPVPGRYHLPTHIEWLQYPWMHGSRDMASNAAAPFV